MFRLRSLGWAHTAVLLLFLVVPQTAEAQRAAAGPPDWPCVQRLIPELAWGTIWTGPSIDELEQEWWEDEEVARMVRFATARTTTEGDAVERVRAFAQSVEEDRERRLTLLFAGLFDQIGRERSRTIDGIRSYARAQVGRLERISELVDGLEEARGPEGDPNEAVAGLEQELFWQQRAFRDRQASLRALCEQPYRLEERLSRLVRVIQAEL